MASLLIGERSCFVAVNSCKWDTNRFFVKTIFRLFDGTLSECLSYSEKDSRLQSSEAAASPALCNVFTIFAGEKYKAVRGAYADLVFPRVFEDAWETSKVR
jgi:hypothetical protein